MQDNPVYVAGLERSGTVVAPSSDQTDAAAIMDLDIADRGRGTGSGELLSSPQSVELSFVEPVITQAAQTNTVLYLRALKHKWS